MQVLQSQIYLRDRLNLKTCHSSTLNYFHQTCKWYLRQEKDKNIKIVSWYFRPFKKIVFAIHRMQVLHSQIYLCHRLNLKTCHSATLNYFHQRCKWYLKWENERKILKHDESLHFATTAATLTGAMTFSTTTLITKTLHNSDTKWHSIMTLSIAELSITTLIITTFSISKLCRMSLITARF
jgi:hypothetical protein